MLRHLIETALNSKNIGWRMEGVILWSVGTGYALLSLRIGILWPRSHSFLPVRGDAAQRPHRMKISPSKHTFLRVASKRGRQKLYIKLKKKQNKKLQDRGRKNSGTVGNGGWTYLQRGRRVLLT